MNHDPEQILAQIKPCRTDGQLRMQVLGAVDTRLRESRRWRLQKRIGLFTLAMVLFGTGLNIWINQTVSQRLAALFPPSTPSRQIVELADFISKHADPQAGQQVYQQVAATPEYKYSPEEYFEYLHKIPEASEILVKGPYHEKSEKDPALDWNWRGSVNRRPAAYYRLLRVDYRFTA
ncbi:MAG: hypothetical protein ABSA26_12915 [Thermoguttaceae bacterium]|jgi:hypothetical protein